MVSQYGRLARGKWLAAQGGVDTVEDAEALNTRYPTNSDRITEIQDLSIRVIKCRPQGEPGTIRIARLREVDPVSGNLVGHRPVCRGPAPRRLVEMVENIPELGEVTCAPTLVHRANRKWWLLSRNRETLSPWFHGRETFVLYRLTSVE